MSVHDPYADDIAYMWSKEFSRLCVFLDRESGDLILDRLGIIPPYYDDPEVDEKIEQMRRLVALAEDLADYVDGVMKTIPDPVWDYFREELEEYNRAGAFDPVHISRTAAHIEHRQHIRAGLIAYGVVFGLDMLEDAVNSDVPFEDILA